VLTSLKDSRSSCLVAQGRVGKSTIALNIADRLAARGHETVLLDLDKDGHMTTQLGYDDAYDRDANLGDALIDGEDPEDPAYRDGLRRSPTPVE